VTYCREWGIRNRHLVKVGERGKGERFGIFLSPIKMSPFDHKSAKNTFARGRKGTHVKGKRVFMSRFPLYPLPFSPLLQEV